MDSSITICAACGKAGDNLKICTACKLVKYCNRDCQISHRSKHKKECRKRAAELKHTKDESGSNTKNIIEGSGSESVSVSVSAATIDQKTSTSYEQKDVDAFVKKLDEMDISDDKLFQDPPQRKDCPICMLPIPHTSSGCGMWDALLWEVIMSWVYVSSG